MTVQAKRFLIPRYGPGSGGIREGFAVVSQEAKGGEVIVFVPKKDHLNLNAIREALGADVVWALRKRQSVEFGLVTLRAESERTFEPFHARSVLAVFPTPKMLELIDGIPNLELVVVVPWNEESVKNWVRTWNPTIPGQAATSPEPIINNSAVEEALGTLTRMINLSTGLDHPSDYDLAASKLRTLKEEGHFFDPGEVRIWALRKGWTPSGASQLKKVAGKVIGGRVVPMKSKSKKR